MADSHPLITTIVVGIVAAFLGGYAARKLKLPSIVGYLVGGILIGPHTPGFVADLAVARQLADIGVILLMFGVGLHFAPKDLFNVRAIAVPGALLQMTVATGLGFVFLVFQGASYTEAAAFGLCLSVASTIVVLRTLDHRRQISTPLGKIAVGWLLVEDLAMILAIVLFPVLAISASNGMPVLMGDVAAEIGIIILKVVTFAVLMTILGRRFLPAFLAGIARLQSRELTALGTLAIALGFAYIAYVVFDASFALGAFLAGMILNESKIGYTAAEQSLPMRDTFAVLFFVSVGMLFDPTILLHEPLAILAVVAIIILGKAFAAWIVVFLMRQTREMALTLAACLSQIGEFSFIFAGFALSHNLMTQTNYNLVLAGALISIAVNPFIFRLIDNRLRS